MAPPLAPALGDHIHLLPLVLLQVSPLGSVSWCLRTLAVAALGLSEVGPLATVSLFLGIRAVNFPTRMDLLEDSVLILCGAVSREQPGSWLHASLQPW